VIHLINNDIINKPIKPYDEEVINFLDDFSKSLLADQLCKQYPDILSFAFWIRKRNIQNLAKKYDLKDRIGWGIAFHITPSNVAMNFIFSYILGLLSGNSNIVRIPSKHFPQIDIILQILKKVLNNYPKISQMSMFISYEKNDVITTDLSNMANIRVVWGGDKTIFNVKKLSTKPRLQDIVFADRYSISVIDSKNLKDYDALAKKFFNDTYLMDQNGCSSPHMILWLNNDKNKIKKFYEALYKVAKKNYKLEYIMAMDKFNQSCIDAVSLNNIQLTKYENFLYIITLNHIEKQVDSLRGKSGYFYEYFLNSLDDLKDIINDKFQTITYFGLERDDIKDIIFKYNLLGVDRIVPVGSAFDFDTIWDGYDIIYNMSRKIKVI